MPLSESPPTPLPLHPIACHRYRHRTRPCDPANDRRVRPPGSPRPPPWVTGEEVTYRALLSGTCECPDYDIGGPHEIAPADKTGDVM